MVIRNSALGDVAMTLPVLYSVARKYPDTEFCLLTRSFFAKIFIDAPANLRILSADYKRRHRGIRGIIRLLGELKREHFTAVADLHNVLRSWIIDAYMYLCGKRVAMVDKKRKDRLSTDSRSVQQSFIDRYVDVFARLGYTINPDFVTLFPESVDTDIKKEPTHRAVGIAPFARYSNKTYPIEQMERVVAMLTDMGIRVYLYGSRGDEAQILDKWAERYEGCTSLAGRMDIASELATMSQMDLMVTMDSANQHLASLVDTEVISIWGSTVPGCGFYGYRQRPQDAILLGLDCQPCTVAGSERCPKGTLACMRGIAPSHVVDTILDRLANS